MDYMFLGSAKRNADVSSSSKQKPEGQTKEDADKIICILHAVDITTLCRTVMVCNKGVVDYVVKGVIDFIRDVGRNRVVLRSDNEPAVKALVDEVCKQRDEETVVEEIAPGNSQTIGTVEHGNFQVGCQVRALRCCTEKKLGITIVPGMAATAWLVRHAG